MEEHDIVVEADGTIRFVYSDVVAEALAGPDMAATTRRASHVEPASAFGIPGGGWIADMAPLGGPLLGDGWEPRDGLRGFATRQAALDAERVWIREREGL